MFTGRAIPRPDRSKLPSCNSYAGLYLEKFIVVSESPGGTSTAGGPGCCVCTLFRIELPLRIGIGVSASPSGDLEVLVDGAVMEVVSGFSGVMRSAGLGEVLYVEPREVYLYIEQEMSV